MGAELGDSRTPARSMQTSISKVTGRPSVLSVSLTLWTYHTWSLCWTLRFLDLPSVQTHIRYFFIASFSSPC